MCKILIVDDSEANVAKLKMLLNDSNFSLASENDGRSALKRVFNESFDLMLLDVVMPGMDGFEVCARMQKNARTASTPVIFLTAQTDSQSIRKGFEAGAVDYVAKPFNQDELLARVHNHLELKKSREEAMEARHIAEEALKYKSEFLANMSHEIRTPINGIIGMSEFLDNTRLDGQQAEYVHIIRSSARSLLNLINDILDFSKLEAGKIELENLDFDLFEHIDDTVKSMAFKAEEKNLTIKKNIAPNVPRVIKGDPTRLRQVLLNLISNAIKFTDEGGLKVSVSLVEELDNHKCLLKFEVADSGVGISEEGLQRLFKSFSQVDASTTRNYGGTGLGLVISKSLTEMMGGKIGVESKLNHGSKFYFTILVGISSLEILRRNMPKLMLADEVKIPRLRILLAEDNLVNQKVASIHLENLGHCVHLASNGLEAFEDFKNMDYDLIFMDIQMPEADGFQSTALIRDYEKQTSKSAKIPIIAMTANAMKGDKEQCIAAGMDDYISKPFTAGALKAILRKYAQTKV